MRHPRLLAWAVALLGVFLCAPLTPAHADSGPKYRLWYSRCAGARRPPAALVDRGRTTWDRWTGSDHRREAWPLRMREAVSAEILSLKGG